MSKEYKIISLVWGDGPKDQKIHLNFEGIAALSKFVEAINTRNVFGENGHPEPQNDPVERADRLTKVDFSNIEVKYEDARLEVDYETMRVNVYAKVVPNFRSSSTVEFYDDEFKYRAFGVYTNESEKITLNHVVTCDVVYTEGRF